MRKGLYFSGVILAALIVVGQARSDDEKEPVEKKVAIDYSKIAEAGPGVYKIVFDAKGRIETCLVVGTSRISTVLGLAKGKEVARQRAVLAADAEFVKWLKAKVSVHQKTEDETILFLEGREENDKDALTESGKATEKTVAKFDLTAKGLVRGLQIVHYEISSKEKTYTIVKKWKAKTAKAVKEVEADLKDKKTDGKSTTKKPIDKKIEDKKGTIED